MKYNATFAAAQSKSAQRRDAVSGRPWQQFQHAGHDQLATIHVYNDFNARQHVTAGYQRQFNN